MIGSSVLTSRSAGAKMSAIKSPSSAPDGETQAAAGATEYELRAALLTA